METIQISITINIHHVCLRSRGVRPSRLIISDVGTVVPCHKASGLYLTRKHDFHLLTNHIHVYSLIVHRRQEFLVVRGGTTILCIVKVFRDDSESPLRSSLRSRKPVRENMQKF